MAGAALLWVGVQAMRPPPLKILVKKLKLFRVGQAGQLAGLGCGDCLRALVVGLAGNTLVALAF